MLAACLGPWRAKEAILMCRHYKANELLAMGLLSGLGLVAVAMAPNLAVERQLHRRLRQLE